MDWKQRYAERIVSAEEALSCIKPGDNVVPGNFAGEPVYLIDELARIAPRIGGKIKVTHGGLIGPEPHMKPGMERYFDVRVMHCVPMSQQGILEHRIKFLPCNFRRWVHMFEHGPDACDVALVMVTPPDENGMCSFGATGDYSMLLPGFAPITIAQVNDCLPFVETNTVPIDAFDYLVVHDEPVVELLDSTPGEKEKAIARNVLPLIKDGDCLQLGRGKLADYVLRYLTDRKDLGVHSEMVSDGIMGLYESGAITGNRKTINKGKITTSMICGSKKLYKWADRNPVLEIRPITYINDPAVIAQLDNVVSLNSAIEIDLLGQAVCDMIGPEQYTGAGGFTDFVRGASESKGGRTILAFSATAGHETVSRIVPHVTAGAAVGATRLDVDWVVTEFGAVSLWGKTNEDRVKALISIAHPKFRAWLTEEAEKANLIW